MSKKIKFIMVENGNEEELLVTEENGGSSTLIPKDLDNMKNELQAEILLKMKQEMENYKDNSISVDGTITSDTKIAIDSNSEEYEFLTKEDVPFIQCGKVSAVKVESMKFVEIPVTFPKAFSAVPNVVCCLNWSGTSATKIGYISCTVGSDTVTKTGFKVRIGNVSPSTAPFGPTLGVQWIAVGTR